MATDKRFGIKLPNWAQKDNVPGYRVDPGPYVGRVKNNVDPTRSGRLQVYIPDFGGDENLPVNWRTVSYASPFYGSTYTDVGVTTNSYDKVSHTYGLWAVPPDVGVEVLCIFAAGDAQRGYWFACVQNHLSHYMTPAVAASTEVDKTNIISEELKKQVSDTSNLPVAEFNENNDKLVSESFMKSPKPIHEYQAGILIKQGLDKDRVRGAITSSSMRETPSMVFGISTPGRPYPNDAADDPEAYLTALQNGTLDDNAFAVNARKGGHSFVMDDGDTVGNDQLMRLRTAGGHQIMMHDKEHVLYIANDLGTVWMEFSPNGQVQLYSYGGINIRTEGDMNLHSDKNLNIQAQNINVKALGKMKLDANETVSKTNTNLTIFAGKAEIGSSSSINVSSESTTSINASGQLVLNGSAVQINSVGGSAVKDPGNITPNDHADTDKDSTGVWKSVDNAKTSIVGVFPTHEPWVRKSGSPQGKPATSPGGGQSTTTVVEPTKVIPPVDCGETSTTPQDPGIASALKSSPTKPLPKEYLGRPDAPNPSSGVGPLSQYQTKCLMGQIAYTESGWKYDIVEVARGNYLGRYQCGGPVLADQGYIKLDYIKKYGTQAVNFDAAWTGKDNINSKADFLKAPSVQEAVMLKLLSSNYNALVRIKGIKEGDSLCTVAGMLQASHLLGAGGARNWREGKGGADANGTTGEQYFNRGRYAVDVLAGKQG